MDFLNFDLNHDVICCCKRTSKPLNKYLKIIHLAAFVIKLALKSCKQGNNVFPKAIPVAKVIMVEIPVLVVCMEAHPAPVLIDNLGVVLGSAAHYAAVNMTSTQSLGN